MSDSLLKGAGGMMTATEASISDAWAKANAEAIHRSIERQMQRDLDKSIRELGLAGTRLDPDAIAKHNQIQLNNAVKHAVARLMVIELGKEDMTVDITDVQNTPVLTVRVSFDNGYSVYAFADSIKDVLGVCGDEGFLTQCRMVCDLKHGPEK